MIVSELVKEILGKNAEILEPLKGGMMNKSYIVAVNGKKYVMFVPTSQANEMVNRYLEKETQAIASRLKITSNNIYFNPETGVKVHEFIDGYSLNHVENIDINRVAGLLKFFHNSPTKSTTDYQPFIRLANFEKEVKQSIKRYPDNYIKLRKLLTDNQEYLESQEKCLCHNDAQKSNIVKEVDTGKYYLIDFEFAANNDPIYDIAAYGNNDVKEGRDLLKAYFNRPNKDEIKRFYLWRIFLSLQWYNVALIKHYRGEGVKIGFDFKEVAKSFLKNALEAYEGYQKEILK